MATKQATKQAEQDNAREMLRGIYPEGSTVTTMVRHVSSSGMSRAITVLAPASVLHDEDRPAEVVNLSWAVARAIGGKLHRTHNGVHVNGAGMDMTFHLVYTLAGALYGDGYALNVRNLD